MHKHIWVFNTDDSIFKEKTADILKLYSARYIQAMKADDLCVLSPIMDIDPDFMEYLAKVKKLPSSGWVFMPKTHTPGDKFIDAILADGQLVERLKQKCGEGYVLIPLMYTKEFKTLSDICGNKLSNNSQAVNDANNKLEFKKVCKLLNIPTPRVVLERDANGKTIQNFENPDPDKMYILKHRFSAGGYGHAVGSLNRLLPIFEKDKEFFIEELVKVEKTIGTLCILTDDITFVGIDEQLIKDEAWQGCVYPCRTVTKKLQEEVKKETMKLARHYFDAGIKGQINFDWAIVKNGKKSELTALECNSRYNGFGIFVRLAATAFNIDKSELHFHIDTGLKVANLTTKKAAEMAIKITKEFPHRGGAVLSSPILNGKAGFCCITDSAEHLEDLREKLRAAIAEHENGLLDQLKSYMISF